MRRRIICTVSIVVWAYTYEHKDSTISHSVLACLKSDASPTSLITVAMCFNLLKGWQWATGRLPISLPCPVWNSLDMTNLPLKCKKNCGRLVLSKTVWNTVSCNSERKVVFCLETVKKCRWLQILCLELSHPDLSFLF